jgi:murein DD-endopeptidase MepM/ murein hydrolase activator NlpD
MKKSHTILIVLLFTIFLCNSYAQNIKHTLGQGETLYSLARYYGVSVDEIKNSNGINDVTSLPLGMVLNIPKQGNSQASVVLVRHKVDKNDTYYSLARRYQLSLANLLKQLGRSETDVLRNGEVLSFSVSNVGNTTTNQVTNSASFADDSSNNSTPPPTGSVSVAPKLPSLNNNQVSVSERNRDNNTTQGFISNNDSVTQGTVKGKLPVIDGLTWPAEGQLSSNKGLQGGVKIAVNGQSRILSVASGRVMYKDIYRELGGQTILVLSDAGLYYVYGGFDTTFVKVGDKVDSATILGSTSRSKDVYFTVFKDGSFIDSTTAPRGI